MWSLKGAGTSAQAPVPASGIISDGTVIAVSYAVRASSSSGSQWLLVADSREVTVGGFELPMGLDAAVRSMQVAELCDVYCSGEDAYAAEAPATGAPEGIDAGAAVVFRCAACGFELESALYSLVLFRVCVERIVRDGAALQSDSQMCFDVALSLKNDGNKLIGQDFSYRALHKYQRALELVAKFAPQPQGALPQGFPAGPETTPMDSNSHSLRCILLSNIAACFLQLRKWNAAVDVCSEVLDKQAAPADAGIRLKTLVRRCKACAELGDWESAMKDARAVKTESAEAWAGLGPVVKRCAEMKGAHEARQRSV
jgi:hypothetical protein